MYSKNQTKNQQNSAVKQLRPLSVKNECNEINSGDEVILLKDVYSDGINIKKNTKVLVSRFVENTSSTSKNKKLRFKMIGFLKNNSSILVRTEIENIKKL